MIELINYMSNTLTKSILGNQLLLDSFNFVSSNCAITTEMSIAIEVDQKLKKIPAFFESDSKSKQKMLLC